MSKQIGERIRAARRLRRRSQELLASEVSLSKMSISKYERGELTPGSSTLLQIAKALEVPVSFFFPTRVVELAQPSYRWNRRHGRPSRQTEERILEAGAILVANLPAAIVLQTDLPHEVAGEAGDPATAFDKVIDGIPHFPAPVLVVAYDDGTGIAVQYFRPKVQVLLGCGIEPVAGPLRPADEVPLIAGPAGRGEFLGVARRPGPIHVGIADRRAQRRRRRRQGPGGAFRQGNKSARQRPLI